MPYGNDEWLKKIEKDHKAGRAAALKDRDAALRQRLRDEFKTPEEFLDLAARIWWDGKED